MKTKKTAWTKQLPAKLGPSSLQEDLNKWFDMY